MPRYNNEWLPDLESEWLASQDEMNTLFQEGFTERDIIILRKGLQEIGENANVFTDEELVATAATVCYTVGRPVNILTRDNDVFEQFFKLTELLVVHYQATLFAERFAADSGSFVTRPLPTDPLTECYFNTANGMLVSKPVTPDEFVYWLLPQDCEPVRLRCILVAGEANALTATAVSFIGESTMLRLVEAKGDSWGLNTTRLHGRNCHVTGFPKSIPNPREYIIVAEDRTVIDPNGQGDCAKLGNLA